MLTQYGPCLGNNRGLNVYEIENKTTYTMKMDIFFGASG